MTKRVQGLATNYRGLIISWQNAGVLPKTGAFATKPYIKDVLQNVLDTPFVTVYD